MAIEDPSWEEPDWDDLSLPVEVQIASRPALVYGGFFRRTIAVLVDAPFLLLLTILGMTLASLAATGGGMLAGDVTRQIDLLASAASLAMVFVVSMIFHVGCWGYGGQTPGKILMRLEVVGQNGEEIGYGRAFLRWIAYFLALIPLGLGFVVALLHPRKRGLHDVLAGTCVIRVDR